jgi:hypothetical protein
MICKEKSNKNYALKEDHHVFVGWVMDIDKWIFIEIFIDEFLVLIIIIII